MRSSPAAAGFLLLGMLPSLAVAKFTVPEKCHVDGVLQYFACKRSIPAECVPQLAEQATSFCSSYMSLETVTIHTSSFAPEVVTETATTVETTTATTTELTTTTSQTVETAAVVTTNLVTSTYTRSLTLIMVYFQKRSVDPSAAPSSPTSPSLALSAAPSCIDLRTVDLSRHPASKLSAACSCLSIEPETVLLQSIATKTTTTVNILSHNCCFPRVNFGADGASGNTQTVAQTDFATTTETTAETATVEETVTETQTITIDATALRTTTAWTTLTTFF
ncbi:hypothetical protein B0H67DRAFT_671634 [Lasiosphaeris hirsuta]|uniref:Uncharacterized protein n=1 Tax=Lasiosphaeris hirsuta TaxID=260670 RepID=A0AA40A283_9PEZI|nr:hypothetical protein B0H67DRAFT_671634 [Lasiosphaeris hirsuta]